MTARVQGDVTPHSFEMLESTFSLGTAYIYT